MGTDNVVFLEVIEWFDETGQELVHRIPEKGSGEIKFGAQLIVRESQAGILFYKGKACHAFGPGRHTLTWHGVDATGQAVASGVYYLRLSGDRTDARVKITLLK